MHPSYNPGKPKGITGAVFNRGDNTISYPRAAYFEFVSICHCDWQNSGIQYLGVKDATYLLCMIIQVDFLRTVLHSTELSHLKFFQPSHEGSLNSSMGWCELLSVIPSLLYLHYLLSVIRNISSALQLFCSKLSSLAAALQDITVHRSAF